MEPPQWNGFDSFIAWLTRQRNDLEAPALRFAPAIGQVLRALRSSDAALARMSGSGATCFGLFETKALAIDAARKIREAQPGWWVQDTALKTG
jgi:4-diphosphocytidyl-2-C-methyl-D-erythritol kinase